MNTEHEQDVEILVNVCICTCVIIVCSLIAIILWNLPEPIFYLLVISMILGCIVGYIDIFMRNWHGWWLVTFISFTLHKNYFSSKWQCDFHNGRSVFMYSDSDAIWYKILWSFWTIEGVLERTWRSVLFWKFCFCLNKFQCWSMLLDMWYLWNQGFWYSNTISTWKL